MNKLKYIFFVSIDMSKSKFGIIDNLGKKISHKKFNNNDLGFEVFLSWLSLTLNSKALFFCMEYTGIYRNLQS